MAQALREKYAHFIDINKNVGTASYKREGIGVEALSIAYNPNIDTYKTILSSEADSVFKNYDIQSSVSGKRIFSDDDIYTMLNTARKQAKPIETTLLEVDMTTTSPYPATKYDVLIVLDEFLGEDATISYNIYYKNPVEGTATISGSGASAVPSFTPTQSL